MSLTQAVMSCLLMVSWVIEVEYTLTAIPQLQNREQARKSDHLRRVFGRRPSLDPSLRKVLRATMVGSALRSGPYGPP